MTTRSAHATIKGYFYQFDHTIVQLLEATTKQSSVVVEGIEDIDLNDGNLSTFVQCKYYEGTEYNHSLIKDAVIQMFKHFHSSGCPNDNKFKYRIYGHYKEGQTKLSKNFGIAFLKKNFLTYEHKKITHEVHSELGVDDHEILIFQSLLNIDLFAPSYDDQQKKITKLLISQIPGCNAEDANVFYYPNAINVIQKLAIQSDAKNRKITKEKFVSEVNRKDNVFSLWLRQKFGEDYYAKRIKRKYFKFSSTKVPKASRFFVIDMTNEFDLSNAVRLLANIGNKFSHVEHQRTPPQDRFCPYILLRGINQQDLVSLKEGLLRLGIKLADGHPFNGSAFSPAHLATVPTKENLIQVKFVPDVDKLASVISAITGTSVEIFDFFKSAPLEATCVPLNVPHHTIKIDTTYFINEVL